MSTHDPNSPGPARRIRPRREHVANILCLTILAIAVPPFLVTLPAWSVWALASTAVVLATAVGVCLLLPAHPPTSNPEVAAEHGGETTR